MKQLLTGGLWIGFLLLFWAVLSESMLSVVPENDLWWMIPTVLQGMEGKSLWEILQFLLSPSPIGFGQPVLKVYLSLVTVWLGLYTRHLVLISVLFHFGNAGLLSLVSRKMGLGSTASLLSGLVYLTFFAHFHAVLWPTAFQHTIAVFTILSVLALYLKTEELIPINPRRAKGFLLAAFAMSGFASLQRSAVLAPILLLTHILTCSKDGEERQTRYDRWLPFFLLFSIYPALTLALVGDVIVNDLLVKIPLPALGRFFLLLGAAWSGLFLTRSALRVSPGPRLRRGIRFGVITGALVLFALLCLRDKRQLALLYNALVPFAATLSSFLDPLRTVFLIDSTEPFHYLPPQISLFGIFLSLFFIGVFGVVFVARHRPLLLWGVWYGLSLVHLLHQYSSFPVTTPSRYFIYVTPVFSVIFCSVLVDLAVPFFQRIVPAPRIQRAFLWMLLVGLCLPNLLAIRWELLRGKLANSFLIYEDVRAAHLIREDLLGFPDAGRISPVRLAVSNVVEMPFRELLTAGWSTVDPSRYDNFRFAVDEAFADKGMRNVQINPPSSAIQAGRWYILEGARIFGPEGRPVDPFFQQFEEGLLQMERGRPQEAFESFQQAIETRPFLLRYLLSSHRLSDLRFVTGEMDLREWIHQIGAGYRLWSETPLPKQEQVINVLNEELSDTILCFFFSAYLKQQMGDREGGRQLLSQIWFLERDPEALISWIAPFPAVRANPSLIRHLQNFRDPAFFNNPIPWRKDDFGVGRFLVRLLFGRDLRSRWEISQGALT